MTISISKALKLKNRQAQLVQRLQTQLTTHNSRLEGNRVDLDLRQVHTDLLAAIDRLIVIKTAISNANAPVQSLIYRIAELKSLISVLRRVDTKEGRQIVAYMQTEPQEFEVTFSASDIEAMVGKYEAEIDDLQDQLDRHNSTTQIEIPDPIAG
ncbi:MAG: hypothetical protein SFX74_12040 [Fimbriimonadaceae bacterium]|nr:hypothetical protein [Fimbriimonadaceae bacterium]